MDVHVITPIQITTTAVPVEEGSVDLTPEIQAEIIVAFNTFLGQYGLKVLDADVTPKQRLVLVPQKDNEVIVPALDGQPEPEA